MHRKRRLAILKKAELRGCTLEPAALKSIEGYLDKNNHNTDDVMPLILETVAEVGGSGRITNDVMEEVLLRIARTGSTESTSDKVRVVDLKHVPALQWDERINGFTHKQTPVFDTLHSLSLANRRVEVQIERYYVIRQRLLRCVKFQQSTHSVYNDVSSAMIVDKDTTEQPPLYKLASLEGMPRTLLMTVLARLSQVEDKYFLEDVSGRIELTFTFEPGSDAYGYGIYHDGCIVVAIGKWSGNIFHCEGLGFPPSEARVDSLAALPTLVDLFGLAPPQNQVRSLEQKLNTSNHIIIFISNINPRTGTLRRLSNLIKGIESDSNTFTPSELTIVMAGDFCENPFRYGDTLSSDPKMTKEINIFKNWFTEVGSTIRSASAVVAKQSTFIIIPGTGDPSPGSQTFPRRPIPSVLTSGLTDHLENVEFAPNPARLRFLTSEIVVFKEDLYSRLVSHALLPPMKEAVHSSLVKTVADQAHLLPLPPRYSAVCSAHDSSMTLYPLPSLVVLISGDKSWTLTYKGCPFANPGSFSRSGTFLMYRPRDGVHELQSVGM